MFEQWMTGQVLEQDNPFYHRLIEGSGPRWINSNTLNFDYSTEDGLVFAKDSGSIEFVIKAGWSLRFQMRTGKWGAFTTLSNEDILEEKYNWDSNNTGLGGTSVVNFTMRAGSAIAVTDGPVSSEYSSLHREPEMNRFGGTSAEALLLRLTTEDGVAETDEIRTLSWDFDLKDHDFRIILLGWERTGQSADDESISEDSEQIEQPESEPKIIESGVGFIVRVGKEGESWIVYLNGLAQGAYDTEAEAITAGLAIAKIEREKSYIDPNEVLDNGKLNALDVMLGGFIEAFPFMIGIIGIGIAVRYFVGVVFRDGS
tara:strand:+ start:75 stop:1016 length:942 start_codon:yes stop_codon:yes gene_type:complete